MILLSHRDTAYPAFVSRMNRRALPEPGVRDLVSEIIAEVAAKGDQAPTPNDSTEPTSSSRKSL